jgi:hypothetical protein
MTEERIVTVDPNPAGTPGTTHTTVITDGGARRGGSGWLIGIVLLVALVAGIWFLSQGRGAEAAKDNAIAEAAGDVGDAAQKVADAAKDAAGSLNK